MSNLTKKQKKGLAFRQRTGKRQSKNELMEMETAAVPIMEDQDIASIQSDKLQDQKECREGNETVRVSDQDKQGRFASKGKKIAGEKNISVSVEVVKTTKRKRSCEDGAQEDQTSEFQTRKVRKRKKSDDVTRSSETKGKTAVKQRFILFVGLRFSRSLNELRLSQSFLGNLKYTTTREAVQAHFAICGLCCSFITTICSTHFLFLCRSSTYNPPAHTYFYFYFRVSRIQIERMRIFRIRSSQRTSTSSQTSPVNAGGTND